MKLIGRLRHIGWTDELGHEAADRIEELERQVKIYNKYIDFAAPATNVCEVEPVFSRKFHDATPDQILGQHAKLSACVSFLIEGCRNSSEGKAALHLWDKYRKF